MAAQTHRKFLGKMSTSIIPMPMENITSPHRRLTAVPSLYKSGYQYYMPARVKSCGYFSNSSAILCFFQSFLRNHVVLSAYKSVDKVRNHIDDFCDGILMLDID